MSSYLEGHKERVVLVTGGAGAIGSNLTRALDPQVDIHEGIRRYVAWARQVY